MLNVRYNRSCRKNRQIYLIIGLSIEFGQDVIRDRLRYTIQRVKDSDWHGK